MDIILNHPQFQASQKIIKKLQAKGHQAFLVGGCVRDLLLHVSPKDLDIVTSATPEQIEQIFEKTVPVGKSFGVILVVQDGLSFEVATFRKESDYQDGRRPNKVEFATIKEDALRRDFTINAMYLDLENMNVLDFVGGQQDLKAKIIRTVGRPEDRFTEDHLRMLRALRFSAQLGFELEESTQKVLFEKVSLITSVSGERLKQELTKLFSGVYLIAKFEKIVQSQIFKTLFPDLEWSYSRFVPLQMKQGDDFGLMQFIDWMLRSNNWSHLLPMYMKVLDLLKLSRDEKKKASRYIDWFTNFKGQIDKPLGLLIEESFDSAVWVAMNNTSEIESFSEKIGQSVEWHKVLDKIKARRVLFNEKPPESLYRAGDLPQGLKPVHIGFILRNIYWAQLEGRISNKQNADALVRQLIVGLK